MRHLQKALVGAATLLLVASGAFAQSLIFDDSVSSCTTDNCSSLTLPGTVLSFGDISAGNFVINTFAASNECLRLDVSSQGADLEMIVIAPDGTVYRNDDSGDSSCPLCPTVKINPTPNNGWYTVHLAHFVGAAVDANFTLLYGRYTLNNSNCSGSTSPSLATQAAEQADQGRKLSGDRLEAPLPNEPGHE